MTSVGLSETASGQLPVKPELQKPWIEQVFKKRECVTYIPNIRDPARCGCGRHIQKHPPMSDRQSNLLSRDELWNIQDHTEEFPTDAYGTIEFQGGPHPTKAQYVRLSHTTAPHQILQLLQQEWELELPKLLITIHGGIRNFELQTKLKRVFRKGLLKAAKTTGAWIVSGGTNTGVMRHVGDALGDTLLQSHNNIVTIGLAPWGVIHNRTELIGKERMSPYHAVASPKSQNVVLNSNHSYFLLVDNGMVGKFGCEVALRKKLEKYISQQKITTRSGSKTYSTPVVCLVLEGGANTIRTILECVTDSPPVPVVVCDGSGRAADLIAFTHKYAQDDGTMPEILRDQLILTIEKTFLYSRPQAEKVFIELMLCVKKKELITVFRMGEDSQDIDLAILTALLKGQDSSAPDLLNLTLSWNRPDIARNQLFVYGQEWPEGALDQAMLDALVYDRVDFVKLLLENGVSMRKWLTMTRLEALYNIGLKTRPVKSSAVYVAANQKQDPSSTLRYLIRENKKHIPQDYRYTLLDIGMVFEKLMGGAYRASYCRRRFKSLYNAIMRKADSLPPRKVQFEMAGHNITNLITEVPMLNQLPLEDTFKYPFSELMVWAVLLRRQRMAKFMWQHGEEALAKALIAIKLYRSMAHEAEQDDLEIDVAEDIKQCSKEFSLLAVELLEACYKVDDDVTQQLLTYKLQNWSDQTCLSLAVTAGHREFLANTCCQILLTDMWMGGLRMRKYTSLKVIFGILFFPSFLFLEFKSKEELQLMPQTMEEHIQSKEDSDSDSSSSNSSDMDDDDRQAEVRQIEETSLRPSSPMPANGQVFHRQAELTQSIKKTNSPLRLGKKIYEFYTAPITKFWAHAFGFLVFLMLYTYVVLIKMEYMPSVQECYIITYILTLTLEKIREIMVSEPKSLSQKMRVHFADFWNISDTIAIMLFLAGVILRLVPKTFGYGKVLYCVSIVFWYVRIMDLFAVSKYLGPYVMMIGKMVKDMLSFIVIMLIVLMAFGVVRQAITYPNEQPQWGLAKNIFLKPYFMIYGEVYAGEIDPECDDDPDSEFKCVPGRFIVPAVMTIYLIVANILLINLLIAVFNNTFHQVNAISNQVWKFQRYSLVIEYESRPILPPPYIIVCHIYLLCKYLHRRCRGKGDGDYFDCGLKLFLDPEAVERLHDFEEECMEDYFRERDQIFQSSTDERIRLTNERVENLTLRLDDINQKENTVKLSLATVDHRMAKLEEMSVRTTEMLLGLQQQMCAIQDSITGLKVPSEDTSQTTTPPSSTVGFSVKSYMSEWEKNILASSYPPPKRSWNEERLRPFTDYKRRNRPFFSRAFSVGTPGSIGREVPFMQMGDTSVTFTNKSLSNTEKFNVHAPYLGSELYNRRRHRSQHTSTSEEDEADVRTKRRQRPGDLRVKFKPQLEEPATAPILNVENEAGLWCISHAADVQLTSPAQYTQATGTTKKVEGFPDPAKSSGDIAAPSMESTPAVPMSLTTVAAPIMKSTPAVTMPLAAMGDPIMESTPAVPVSLTASAVPKNIVPITPIITPTRMEYTSITDDIDTSVVNHRTPPGSPTTPKRIFFGIDVDLDLYTNKLNKLQKKKLLRGNTHESVEQLLKSAEESVRAQMENVIRKRIRQISLTDSDDLGELAKHVAMDMEASDNEENSAPSYHSDEEELHTRNLAVMPIMKSVKSEPSLKSLVKDHTGHTISKSASPPHITIEDSLGKTDFQFGTSGEGDDGMGHQSRTLGNQTADSDTIC